MQRVSGTSTHNARSARQTCGAVHTGADEPSHAALAGHAAHCATGSGEQSTRGHCVLAHVRFRAAAYTSTHAAAVHRLRTHTHTCNTHTHTMC